MYYFIKTGWSASQRTCINRVCLHKWRQHPEYPGGVILDTGVTTSLPSAIFRPIDAVHSTKLQLRQNPCLSELEYGDALTVFAMLESAQENCVVEVDFSSMNRCTSSAAHTGMPQAVTAALQRHRKAEQDAFRRRVKR